MKINEISVVAVLKNVMFYNKQNNESFVSKKGVLIIEDIKGKRIILDLLNMEDLTNMQDKFEIVINRKKTKMKYLYKKEV